MLLKWLKKLLIIVILAFIFCFFVSVFNRIFFKLDSNYINNAVGAFMGAFFAFLFIRVADYIEKINGIKKMNNIAIIKIERICNEYLDSLHMNIILINDIVHTLDKSISEDKPFISFNTLRQLYIERDITLNILNRDYLNDVFSYVIGITKVNNSMESINYYYVEMKECLIQRGQYEPYKNNIPIIKEKLLVLKGYMENLLEETKQIVAKTRYLLKEKYFYLPKEKYDSRINTFVSEEMKTIEKEIENNQKESKDRKDKILGSIAK